MTDILFGSRYSTEYWYWCNQFIDGCSAIPAAQGIDGAQVNHDLGSLKPCAYRSHRACPT
jgi:hypothetical protein